VEDAEEPELSRRLRADPLPDKTPRAERPLRDMTCIASRTEAAPGRDMRGCRVKETAGEEMGRARMLGWEAVGSERRCSRRARSLRILGAPVLAVVIASLCKPEAKSGRRERRGVSAANEWYGSFCEISIDISDELPNQGERSPQTSPTVTFSPLRSRHTTPLPR
jgi:hypothetical protein